MPRQRGGAAPVRPRPTVPAARPATTAPAPARQHSTAAAPTQSAPPPAAATPQGPGLFGQMASTAAGVAVGSSIGHAVGGWFSGGSSAAPAEASPQTSEFASQHTVNSTAQQAAGPCAENVNTFRKCMDENQGSLTICGWYLDQLKACQSAAGQY